LRLGELNGTRIAARIGQGMAILLGLFGLVVNSWNLMLIAAFVFISAEQEWRGTQLRTALRSVPASAALLRGGVALSPSDPLSRAIETRLRTDQTDFAVFDRGYLRGVLTRENVAEGFRRYGSHIQVERVMRTDFPVAQAGDSLLDLERRMRTTGNSAISIVEGGRFLGLATLESVRRALRLSATRQWRPGQV
jgi:hypothetical protein